MKLILLLALLPIASSIGTAATCPIDNPDIDPITLGNAAIEDLMTRGFLLETIICMEIAVYRAITKYEISPELFDVLKQNLRALLAIVEPPKTAVSQRMYHTYGLWNPKIFPANSSEPLQMPGLDRSIGVWDGALSKEQCESMIELFNNSQIYEGNLYRNGQIVIDHKSKKASEFDVSGTAINNVTWAKLDRFLVPLAHRYLSLYQEQNQGVKDLPNPLSDEGFRMKRYLNDGTEHHAYHGDSGHESRCSPKRHIAMLIYLNDVSEGGETVFYNQGIAVQPKCGRVCLFPTAFTHIHAGRRPVSENKYVLTNFFLA